MKKTDDHDLPDGDQPTREEKALLDRELKEFEKNPHEGSTWEAVEARLLRR